MRWEILARLGGGRAARGVLLLALLAAVAACRGTGAPAPEGSAPGGANAPLAEPGSGAAVAPGAVDTGAGGPQAPGGDAGVQGAPAADEPQPTAGPASEPTQATATSITGRVTDENGDPIVDASVYVVKSSVPAPEMAVFTSSSGFYYWRLPAGTYTLEAYRDGYQTSQAEVTVEAGQTAQLDLTLAAE